MEVWLTHQGERLRLPITPFYNIEEPQNNNTETLNEVGTVNLKGKKGLRSLTIESFFPSKEYDFLESSDVVLDPFYYDDKIRNWANSDEPIRLIITETPHNFEVLIDSYTSGEQDGTGDVYYRLALSEYVRIEATEYEPPEIKRTIKANDIKRFAGVVAPTAALLTIGKYDTVWSLGKKITGNGKNGKQLLKQSGLKKINCWKGYKAMKLILNGKDISQFYNEVTWGGDKGQAARQLDFGVVVSGTDKNLPQITVPMNAKVKLINDDGIVLFDGFVFSKEKSIDNNIMSVTCLDKLILANKSKGTFNFEKKTPDAIAREAFGSIGLSVGKAESGSPIDRKFDLETIYNIVFTAYKMENEKTGKPYMIRMNNGAVDIVEQGKIVAKYVLDGKSNLYNATYGENSENVVSKVKMFDTEGKPIGEVTNNVEGGIVEVYRQEKDEDPEARARGMLKDIERTASVRVKGDFDLITGNAVIIKEPFTGLNGKFYIISDKHTFANNYHVVDLELSYDNVMEDIDTSQESESDGTGSSVSASGSTGQKAIQIGESIKGTHYKWGGTDPKTGVDCSGFVTWAFKQAGANIPGRITSDGIRSNPKALGFKEIPFSERQPGDVLWQKGHVAMQYDATRIIESGGVSKRILGYSGVCVSNQKGRTFSKAYRYVGG